MQPPLVLYLASHYNNAAGVESYLLHYASKMRRRGFDTRIVVFEQLQCGELTGLNAHLDM